MRRSLGKGSAWISVAYSEKGASTDLLGRNFEIEDPCLIIDLTGNLRVRNKRENCCGDILEFASAPAKLKSVQIFDEQVIEGLRRALQRGFDLKELELVVQGRGTFKYSVVDLNKAPGSILLYVQSARAEVTGMARKKAGATTVNLIKLREELKDKLALERYISHADIHPTVYKRLEKRGYLKDAEITDKGKILLSGANE